jgi:glycosyltransferase involved in cell wall biosynthesis
VSEPQLSIIVITKNEAHRIERCLRSVAFADELIVVDSGSTDETVALARGCGAHVTVTDWPGFGPQKNRALALARGRWVLSIDADEEVDDELRAAIQAVVRNSAPTPMASAPSAAERSEDGAADARPHAAPQTGAEPPCGYWVRRSSRFCGTTIRFGDWRRDRVLRLFLRARARFSDDLVHERVICPLPHAELAGGLLHDSVDSMPDAIEKAERYARLGARKLRQRGRGGLVSAVVHGCWAFVRGYLLRLGFLDGRPGLSIAALNAWGTYRRYRLAGMPASHEPEGEH